MDFSPRHAETLQLSPSHLHNSISSFHDDLRNLRRSISRSPSRMMRLHRPTLDLQTSPSKHSPLSHQLHPHTSLSPLVRTPREGSAPIGSRRSRPSLARATPIKANIFSSARPELQSLQSARRPLSVAADFGNSSSQPLQEHAAGQENQATTPDGSPPDSQIFTVSRPKPQNSPFRVPAARPKSIAATEFDFLKDGVSAKSSPLKRSDGVMNLDQPCFGSPSAKRRSLHGATFEIARDDDFRAQPTPQSDGESEPDESSFCSAVSSRPGGALRKSHGPLRFGDRTHTSRNRRSLEVDLSTPAPRRAQPKAGARGPSDSESGLVIDGVGAASPAPVESRQHFVRPVRPHPHPLSKTITPASPLQSSIAPVTRTASNVPDTPDGRPLFAKSLPIGALRPHPRTDLAKSSTQTPSTNGVFATPRAFDNVRPDPIAFQSTGLISKRHRDPDDMPPPPGQHGAMPDTPCKRGSMGLADANSPTSISSIAKPRFGQPLFGPPADSPYKGSTRPTPSFGSGAPLGLNTECDQNRLNRSTSFISNDGSDCGRSPQGSYLQGESHSSADELPPTPTKQIAGLNSARASLKNNSLRSNLFGRRASVGPNMFSPAEASEQVQQGSETTKRLCKLSQPHANESVAGSTILALGSLQRIPTHPISPAPSLGGTRLRRRRSPSNGLSSEAWTSPQHYCLNDDHWDNAKIGPLHPVTQPLSTAQNSTPLPHTPADLGFPDPSQLSISPSGKVARTPTWRSSIRSTFSRPPETPSTHRESAQNPNFPGLTTPSHHAAAGREIDASLSQRFKKVVWLGQGQFSDVYKVHREQPRPAINTFFSPRAARGGGGNALSTSLPDEVYVVKKTRASLHGSRVRERTVREAEIMQALGHNDYVVRLVDSWEADHHLYLMTEFCEEGALDKFLEREGRNGRLDDFRIWKIMLEVASGLQHIHTSGFMHLDLKPENIFIDFAGTLKIGDFGLACEWPAPRSVEGEGDRRYIGPDLLTGNFDRPADIFAFGMMMYEIAGNVVPPDNGASWQKLRSGDFSGLPSLTSGSSHSLSAVNSSTFARSDSLSCDDPPFSPSTDYSSRPDLGTLDVSNDTHMASTESLNTPRVHKSQKNNTVPATELAEAPAFMLDPGHTDSLDSLVHWMMLPLPGDRPTVERVLQAGGCRWTGERRRAGAVVWEGKWGPSDTVLMQEPRAAMAQDTRSMSIVHQDTQGSSGTFLDDADAEMMDA